MWASANGLSSLRALPRWYHMSYVVFISKSLPVAIGQISFYVGGTKVILTSLDFAVVLFDF
jgi:hypothetical protein